MAGDDLHRFELRVGEQARAGHRRAAFSVPVEDMSSRLKFIDTGIPDNRIGQKFRAGLRKGDDRDPSRTSYDHTFAHAVSSRLGGIERRGGSP